MRIEDSEEEVLPNLCSIVNRYFEDKETFIYTEDEATVIELLDKVFLFVLGILHGIEARQCPLCQENVSFAECSECAFEDDVDGTSACYFYDPEYVALRQDVENRGL